MTPTPDQVEPTITEAVERVAAAIHTHLSRRNIMQYLDNDEDCEGLARVAIEALAESKQPVAEVERLREESRLAGGWCEHGKRITEFCAVCDAALSAKA